MTTRDTTARAATHTTAPAEIFESIVRSRKSVRAFRPETLPDAKIRQLLELASWAPSNCNTQPWIVHVASGQVVCALSEELLRDAPSRVSRDVPYNADRYPPTLQGRMIAHITAQQAAFGIAREDSAARDKLRTGNLTFFGAPHVLFLYLPAFANEREAADVGMFAQTFMLALEAHGLASVPQTSVGSYAAPIRRILHPAADAKLLFAISFGFEDRAAPRARLSQERAPLSDFVTFHSEPS